MFRTVRLEQGAVAMHDVGAGGPEKVALGWPASASDPLEQLAAAARNGAGLDMGQHVARDVAGGLDGLRVQRGVQDDLSARWASACGQVALMPVTASILSIWRRLEREAGSWLFL